MNSNKATPKTCKPTHSCEAKEKGRLLKKTCITLHACIINATKPSQPILSHLYLVHGIINQILSKKPLPSLLRI